jgi:hypothetical protein
MTVRTVTMAGTSCCQRRGCCGGRSTLPAIGSDSPPGDSPMASPAPAGLTR